MASKNKLAIDTAEFWDEEALLREERRQFDVCHNCRLCWNFCPAFPALFERTDAADGDWNKLGRQDLRPVEDLCYQCKLCYIRCPYTPPHQYDMDVPRLFMRAKFINARKDGVAWQDRFLGDTDRNFSASARVAPLANLANSTRPIRFVMEKTVGIHHNASLPKFRTRTFAWWFKKHGESLNRRTAADGRKAAFFYTCYVNYSDVETGIACAEVLTHNGVQVSVPQQQCCGMPFLDGGAVDLALKKIRANVRSLVEGVRQGYDIVVPGPSCSYMIKQEYPQLDTSEEAHLVAQHTFDVSEYLWKLHEAGALKKDFKVQMGKVAYHAPCHARAQFMGNKGARLMELIPGTTVEQVERCSHHDGTWGVKKDSYRLSIEYGEKLFQAMKDTDAQVYTSDCPLAAAQIEHGTGRRPVHPMQVLKTAYGL